MTKKVMRSSRSKENTQYNNHTFLVIILCVLLWSTASHYLFGHYIVCSPLIYCFSLPFWSLYCVFSFDLLLLITFLVIIFCVLLWSTASHYLFGHYIVCSPQRRTHNIITKKVMRSSRSKENTKYNDQKGNEKQ
jgi:hypothetical protein